MNAAAHAVPGIAFRICYPLAFLGAHLAFMPLLILLLPRRVELVAPLNPAVHLSILLLVGGVVASFSHIAAGRWSDRWMEGNGSRRLPVAVGLLGLVGSYAGLAAADSMPALLGAIIVFQIGVNVMFAPLGALLADYVHDLEKARMAAWLALALPTSVAASGLIAFIWPMDSKLAFLGTAAAVALCVLPLLIMWPNAGSLVSPWHSRRAAVLDLPVHDFRLAWIARLLVQCGAALVINYLYFYLAQLPATSGQPSLVSRAVALLLTLASVAGMIATVAAGQVSDRLNLRRLPIAVSGIVAAGGLFVMALQPSWPIIIVAYCVFSAGLTAFLSIDSAMVAQMVGQSPDRGKWLGIMNLTNTLPAIIIPALALGAVQITTGHGLALLIASAATGTCCAVVLVMRVKSVR